MVQLVNTRCKKFRYTTYVEKHCSIPDLLYDPCVAERHLGELDLADCGLGDGDVEGLRHVVKSCSSLTLLDLRYKIAMQQSNDKRGGGGMGRE